MARKTHDLAAKTGEYTDRDGNTKGRYQNVGALMEDDDGRKFIILQRWFNPAGLQSDRESVIISCFEPRERDSGSHSGGSGSRQGDTRQGQGGAPAGAGGSYDDSEIPF